jgi:large subunit ribosomal protein L32
MSGGVTPKRRKSRSRTRSRRAQWKTNPPTLAKCPRCREAVLPHTACSSCGWYKGREYAEAIRNENA